MWEGEGRGFVKSVHELRHCGASEGTARGRRDSEGVRRRGRWRHVTSVDRYTKVNLLVAARQSCGDSIIKKGEEIAANPRMHVLNAIRKGPGIDRAEGQAIVKELTRSGTMPDAVESVRPGWANPREEPVGDVKRMPAFRLERELQRRGPPIWSSRAQNERTRLKSRFLPSRVESYLDSDDGTVCTGEPTDDEDDEEMDLDQIDQDQGDGLAEGCFGGNQAFAIACEARGYLRKRRQAGRRKLKMTARAKAFKSG